MAKPEMIESASAGDKKEHKLPALFFDVRNAVYLEDGRINCDVQSSEGEAFIPFTASANDPEEKGRQLYEALIRGVYGEVTPFIITNDVLEAVKRQKMEEISGWRDRQENGNIIFELDGHRWDASKASQERLAPVVQVASAGELPAGFFWTDADNNDVPVDAAALRQLELAMQSAMVKRGFQIHERQRQMKDEVFALTLPEAIKQYRPGWPEDGE
ncbi:DUF4376 domain-containing protein [Citrobacter meridianamericanus]|uniref:DUF4376 domain-containing protein n=1 Tax=Citrobacter meridianamericanus TaxID=2894201 RepID=UPI00351D21E9